MERVLNAMMHMFEQSYFRPLLILVVMIFYLFVCLILV